MILLVSTLLRFFSAGTITVLHVAAAAVAIVAVLAVIGHCRFCDPLLCLLPAVIDASANSCSSWLLLLQFGMDGVGWCWSC